MTFVEVSAAAVAQLEDLVESRALPANSRARIVKLIEPLARFPLSGSALQGRWTGYRFLLGPWNWLIIVYFYEPEEDRVIVVSFQDSRTSDAATSE